MEFREPVEKLMADLQIDSVHSLLTHHAQLYARLQAIEKLNMGNWIPVWPISTKDVCAATITDIKALGSRRSWKQQAFACMKCRRCYGHWAKYCTKDVTIKIQDT